MEFVFVPITPSGLRDQIFMTRLIFDTRPSQIDPFFAVAKQVPEPLLSGPWAAIHQPNTQQVSAIVDLRAGAQNLSTALRSAQQPPSGLRQAVRMSLIVVANVVLSIVATRLDPVVDRIDWPTLYNWIVEAVRQLHLN